jgi:hypothetical protein
LSHSVFVRPTERLYESVRSNATSKCFLRHILKLYAVISKYGFIILILQMSPVLIKIEKIGRILSCSAGGARTLYSFPRRDVDAMRGSALAVRRMA